MSTRGPSNRFEVRLGRIRSPSGHARVTGFLKKSGSPPRAQATAFRPVTAAHERGELSAPGHG